MKILSRFFVRKFKKATMNCRTLTENHPDRGLATNTYDKSSNLISMNRASIGAISFRYSYNRLLSRTMPGSSGNDLYDVVYTYGTLGDGKNGAGRIVAIDQGQGFKVDHYSYDELGQRVVEQSTIQVPQVGQRTYQTEFKYSSFGRILQASYPDGDVVNYHYTDKGELFSIESTAPGEPKLFVVQETQYNGFGQIGTLIYGNGTKTTYNYASSDFVTSGLGHLNKTALFTSTVEGKATLGGATTSLASRDYQYSNLGMVSSLNKSIHSSLAAGITSLDYSFSYDDKGRLLGSTLATGGMNIYELTMGYNAVGGITSKDSDLPNGGQPLVNPNLEYDLSYSYNPAKPHQLLSVTEVGPNGGITNFSYDDVGNLTESFGPSGTEELIWNELQQLSGVMNGNGIHHYVYDHNGERIMKSSINRSWVQVNDQNVDDIQYLEPYTLYVNPYYVVTSFHNGDHISKHYYMNTQRVATDISINYQGPPPPIALGAPMSSDSAQSTGMGISASFEDDLNKILQQFDAGDLTSSLSENGVTMEKYYPNAASESESINRILYWYHPDYLGSVDLVTDRNGVAYEFFLYTPWGENMYSYNAGTSSFTSTYRFNGKELDQETGYHYYGARYYQSKFSVWMSVDPLAHETLDSYSFTSNNPITMVDPDGRNPIAIGLAIAGAVTGIIVAQMQGKDMKETIAMAIGGAVGGFAMGYGIGLVSALGGAEFLSTAGALYIKGASSIAGSLVGNVAKQSTLRLFGKQDGFDEKDFIFEMQFSLFGEFFSSASSKVIDKSVNSYKQYFAKTVTNRMSRRRDNEFIKTFSKKLKQADPRLTKHQRQLAAEKTLFLVKDLEAELLDVKIYVTEKTLHVTLITTEGLIQNEIKDHTKE